MLLLAEFLKLCRMLRRFILQVVAGVPAKQAAVEVACTQG
jgi:hypothetical protein